MKYIHFALVSLLFAALFSCSKNGDSAKPSKTLVGKWKMTSFTYTGTSTVVIDGQSASSPFSGTGKDIDASISFAQDNTYTSEGSYTIALTMGVGGQQIKEDMPIQGFMGSGTWKKDGNKVMITDDATGNNETCTILQLDDKTLKMQWGGTLSPANSYNTPVTLTVNGTYVFERE
jgi:hypothetical protein